MFWRFTSVKYKSILRDSVKWVVLFAFISFFCAPKLARAVDVVTLRVVTEDWKPFSYLDKNNKITGSTAEKVRRILTLAGIPYTLEILPWTRAYRVAIKEPNVLIYSILYSHERSDKFHFICPLV